MRHNKHHASLGVSREHRAAMLSNMAASLITHGRIETTLAKAKALRPFVEKVVTKAKQAAAKTDAINDWGSVVALSYIAAQRVFPGYGDMADAKALLESIGRSWGYHLGISKKIRVNTVSQSPTMTTAGSGIKGFDGFFGFAQAMSPLGNAPAQDCANYCITLFSDLTRFVTMQNLFHDGGFSTTGVTPEVMANFMKEQ